MIARTILTTLLFLATTTLLFQSSVVAQEEDVGPQPAWVNLSSSQRREVMAFAEDYKGFMSHAKTELSFVTEAVKIARKGGFRELTESSNLQPGARFYDINRDRSMTLIVVGSNDFVDGFRVVGAHIDSPRLELKGRPVYEDVKSREQCHK